MIKPEVLSVTIEINKSYFIILQRLYVCSNVFPCASSKGIVEFLKPCWLIGAEIQYYCKIHNLFENFGTTFIVSPWLTVVIIKTEIPPNLFNSNLIGTVHAEATYRKRHAWTDTWKLKGGKEKCSDTCTTCNRVTNELWK